MVTQDEVINVVRSVCKVDDISMATTFEDLGIDSTQVLEILIEFEIKFQIDILDESLQLDQFHSVEDVHAFFTKFMK
jgi:acyl carrier protein